MPLWANLHGSIVMACGIYALVLAAISICQKRYLQLLIIPCLAIIPLLTPYGFKIIEYYQTTLFNSQFSLFIMEWQPLKITFAVGYFILLGLVFFLAGSTWSRLNRIRRGEVVFLILMVLPALYGARYMLWGGMAALLILPNILDTAWPATSWKESTDRHFRIIGILSCFAIIGILAYCPFINDQVYLKDMPSQKVLKVLDDRVPLAEPIMLSERYTDWLLWNEPSRHVAYTVRLELLKPADYKSIRCFYQVGAACQDPRIKKSNVFLVENTKLTKDLLQSMDQSSDFNRIYKDKKVVIYLRKDFEKQDLGKPILTHTSRQLL